MDWLGLGGVFGGTLGGGLTAGAQQQQANVMDLLRHQQTGAMNAAPASNAEWAVYTATKLHIEEVRAAHDGPDWMFWYWWVGLSVAAQICRLLHLAA